jgi:1-acylglycerone phosphate reductase
MQLFRDIFEVNIFGVVMMCQEFVRLLIAAEGLIVNIGSVAPMMPLLYTGPYNASKGALHAYGDTLRVELKPFNVHVMTVSFITIPLLSRMRVTENLDNIRINNIPDH